LLKLKKLELHGFKSFCEREHFQFNGSGIVAVVGPNGCGKSNVGDAISWVLGERSAKSLRGSQMKDVIFAGSRDRKASGLATVSMTMLDPEAYLEERRNGETRTGEHHNGEHRNGEHRNGDGAPKGPAEVVVTRKLFQSGESEYLINGKACRLRDIQDLFLGTGLGPEHYAIIEQGRIGQILSSKPIDRRAFVEEAAGVTKFKQRKRLAELKLESARQNLNRVNDILQEVTRQVNSLKRQASKAKRYEEIRGQLGEALSLVLAHRYRWLDQQARQAAAEMENAQGEYRRRAERVAAIEAELGVNRGQEQTLEAALERSRQELSALSVEMERLRSRIEKQAGLADENQKRVELAGAEAAHLDERVRQLHDEAAVEQQAVESVAGQVETVRGRLVDKNIEVENQQQAFRELEGSQEGARQKVLRLLGELSALRNELAKIEEFLAGNERQASRTKEEQASAEAELAELAQTRLRLEQQVEAHQKELDSLGRQRDDLDVAISELKQQAQARRTEAERLQKEVSKLGARRDSLEEILSHHAYTTETVKNLFTTIGASPVAGFEPVGILADFVEVDPKFERATEEFLREELEYVVVHSWQEARQGIHLLRSEMQGFATFLVHPEAPVAEETPALGPETGVVGRLAEKIRLTNGLSASASTVLPRLRSCYLVEDEETARRLALQYPDFHFLLPSGVCYRGYTVSGGKKSAAGPLALKRELRELRPTIQNLEQSLETASSEAAQAEQQITARTAEMEAVRAQLQNLEKAALAAEHELRESKNHVDKAERRLSLARLEMERLTHEQERAAAESEQKRAAVDQRERERLEAEEALTALRQQLEEGQRLRSQLVEEQTGLRTELATLEERHKAANASLARALQAVEEHEQRRQRILEQIQQWGEERERLLADNLEIEQRLTGHAARHEQLQNEVKEAAGSLEQLRGRTVELETEVKAVREELEAAREQRSAIELNLVQLRSDLKHLTEECQRELHQPIDQVAAAHTEELTEEELAAAEQSYQQLREKLESLGPVNVLALEEYEEARQRMEFLEAQHGDLLDSIRDTQKAITEIDTASRRQFEIALEAINNNFREIFRTLFGGGIAEMRLSDEENPAEAGVDIVASPPGKRLQNIALLSGGEKSLTALALLMATFKFRPSPFCVLDEVDAALDESNLYRFRQLVEHMCDQTQFIIITHSKTTMEVAETLYGVTMAEPGVSRLVSVRMPNQKAAPAPEEPIAVTVGA
jgi:chromosome segregation protein